MNTANHPDGIEVATNPVPAWWTAIFVTTILFAACYLFVDFSTDGHLSTAAAYQRDFTEALKAQYGQLGDPKPDAATLIKLSKDEKWSRVGQSLFQTNCATCHGSDGSGVAGPNLTDDRFVHIKQISDIADVIAVGRKNGAMPAWNGRLQPVEQVLISAYVASLRGKNLPSMGGRPAEGETIAPWPDK